MQERQGGIKNLLARIGRAWAAVHDRRQARRVGLFWLAGAAVLHVGCAVAVLLAGRWGVAPALVDAAGIVGGAADSHDSVSSAATLAQR